MVATTSTYTVQRNWVTMDLISVNIAFYSSWERRLEGSMRGQEKISLGGGDCMPRAPQSCQSSKGVKEVWINEGRSWSAT